MSFSNILSTSDLPPPNATCPLPKGSNPSLKPFGIPRSHESEHQSRLSSNPESPAAKRKFEKTVHEDSISNGVPKATLPSKPPTSPPCQVEGRTRTPGADNSGSNRDDDYSNLSQARYYKPRLVVSERDFQTALAKINAMELSDVEDPAFEEQKVHYARRTAKRLIEFDDIELSKRKVNTYHLLLDTVSFVDL